MHLYELRFTVPQINKKPDGTTVTWRINTMQVVVAPTLERAIELTKRRFPDAVFSNVTQRDNYGSPEPIVDAEIALEAK